MLTVYGKRQGTSLSCESGVYFVVNYSELPENKYVFALLQEQSNGWWVCLNWVKG